MADSIATIRKAVIAFLTTVATALVATAQAASVDLSAGIAAGVSGLIAAVLVYLTPNKPAA